MSVTASDQRTIEKVSKPDVVVDVPPSKSYTNRALIISALASGVSELLNPSTSDDSLILTAALRQFGVQFHKKQNTLQVFGTGGNINTPDREVYLGNAGTALRFLATFASLAPGATLLTGDDRMKERPIGDLLKALLISGIRCLNDKGYPPITIYGGQFEGGTIPLDATISSQFLSSLLLSSPYAERPVRIRVHGTISSRPYISMTMHAMREFGARVELHDESEFTIDNTARYTGRSFRIEPDATSASYFFAAAAVTGGRVRVNHLSIDTLQGDIKFLDVLSEMGCMVITHPDQIEVQGGRLQGVDVDMNAMPDCVPTLAVVAAFADGPTRITNVAHLRHKETDRFVAIRNELTKIGATVAFENDGIIITPGHLTGATIETYHDHRMAMSFAVAGLGIGGVHIQNPSCVSKSFPDFWNEFTKLEHQD
jgi:3-phosphoshikimate 1-carboxyvinyltransferase